MTSPRPPYLDQVQAAVEQAREPLGRMVRQVAQEAAGRIAAAPLTPQRVAEIVAGAQATADDEISGAAAVMEERTGRKVGCGAGCHRCCFQTIEISTVEAVAIVARIPEEDRVGMADEVEALAARVAGLTKPARYRQGVGCVFLEGQICGIYEARPSACRGYLSLSRSACRRDWSERFSDRRRPGVPLIAEAQMLAHAFSRGVDLAMQAAGLEVEHVEMTRAVAVLLQPGAIERWLAGERIFAAWRHLNPHTGLSHADSLAAGRPAVSPNSPEV